MRRFEVGPILVALAAVLLLVSLFLEWYGPLTAWDAFEVVEVLLLALAATALVIAVGQLSPDLDYLDRRWLPPVVLAVAVLVAAELINPPPAAGIADDERRAVRSDCAGGCGCGCISAQQLNR